MPSAIEATMDHYVPQSLEVNSTKVDNTCERKIALLAEPDFSEMNII